MRRLIPRVFLTLMLTLRNHHWRRTATVRLLQVTFNFWKTYYPDDPYVWCKTEMYLNWLIRRHNLKVHCGRGRIKLLLKIFCRKLQLKFLWVSVPTDSFITTLKLGLRVSILLIIRLNFQLFPITGAFSTSLLLAVISQAHCQLTFRDLRIPLYVGFGWMDLRTFNRPANS